MDSQVSGIFRCCVEAIDAGVLIERESSKDKEFHFQNWFASGRSTGRKTMSRIAVFLIVLTLPLSAQTEQKSKPSRLESLFSKYELSSLNPEAIKRQIVDRGEPLTLEVYGRQFVFEMKPRDMRSQRYSAEATVGEWFAPERPSPASRYLPGSHSWGEPRAGKIHHHRGHVRRNHFRRQAIGSTWSR